MALKDYIIIINMHNVLSFYCDFQWFYKYLFIIQENLSFVSVQLYDYKKTLIKLIKLLLRTKAIYYFH